MRPTSCTRPSARACWSRFTSSASLRSWPLASCASKDSLPLVYKDTQIDAGFRLDLLIERLVVVEIKAVERILAVHEAQILTYLKLSGYKLGLLINFNVVRIKDGLKRLVFS